MTVSDRILWIWLSLACGPGYRAYGRLFTSFQTLRGIYEASLESLLTTDGIDRGTAAALADKDTRHAEEILEFCRRRGWGVLTYGDRAYPSRLRMIKDPPIVLYVRGRLIDLNDNLCIAVVGTRTMSDYGERQAYRLAFSLAVGGAIIVSGMALGCDAMAANGALDAGAPTVAVLGCGLDIVYPRQHETLEDHIARSGMVVTEYPPGSPPEGRHFPVRNRIISGLSQGTLVVEAPQHSGALITAEIARTQGREIFAVPGEADSEQSYGCNELLKDEAQPVTSVYDLLRVYEFIYPHRINVKAAMRAERDAAKRSGRLTASLRNIARRVEKSPVRGVRAGTVNGEAAGASAPLRMPGIAARGEPQKERLVRSVETATEEVSVPAGLEGEIYLAIGEGGMTPDELSARGYSSAEIMTALTMLEISGLVTAVPGGRYVRCVRNVHAK